MATSRHGRTIPIHVLLKFLSFILYLSVLDTIHTTTWAESKKGWDLLPDILNRINPPTFPDRDFVVTDYGAVGDDVIDCTKAGGGRVVVPEGIFLTDGPQTLRQQRQSARNRSGNRSVRNRLRRLSAACAR